MNSEEREIVQGVLRQAIEALEPLACMNVYPEDHRPEEIVEIRVAYADIQRAASVIALAKRYS